MATYVLQNCKLYLAGYDLSSDMNEMALAVNAEDVPGTTFGAGAVAHRPGLEDIEASARGYWDADAAAFRVDDVLWSQFRVVNNPLTYCPTTGAVGERAFSFQAAVSEYSPGGSIGEMFAFDVSSYATGGRLVRMTVMESGTKTVTGNGTVQNLGAVAAGQKLYAVLHVLGVTGTTPSITVKVQSSAVVGFSSPVDRITFNAATARGAQWATPVSGAITDAYWRVTVTVSGTSPNFQIVCAVGIQ